MPQTPQIKIGTRVLWEETPEKYLPSVLRYGVVVGYCDSFERYQLVYVQAEGQPKRAIWIGALVA